LNAYRFASVKDSNNLTTNTMSVVSLFLVTHVILVNIFCLNAYRFASVKDSNNLTTNTISGVFDGKANNA
jgi:hypothetical protein